jgi:hypothetical protein
MPCKWGGRRPVILFGVIAVVILAAGQTAVLMLRIGRLLAKAFGGTTEDLAAARPDVATCSIPTS